MEQSYPLKSVLNKLWLSKAILSYYVIIGAVLFEKEKALK